nr:AAA family ATPase [uncultured Anaerobutyricum sp.]
MKLSIRDFAKIKKADIVIDGITVIAGENNTGKSTVGKILFSLFNSLSDIEEKIFNERMREVEKSNEKIMYEYFDGNITYGGYDRLYLLSNLMIPSIRRNKNNSIEKIEEDVRKELYKYKNSIVGKIDDDLLEEMIHKLGENIKSFLEIPEENIILEVVSEYFSKVFSSQTNSLLDKGSHDNSILALKIKNRQNRLFFQDNRCVKMENDINIIHKAIYIDNPFIVDELSGDYNGVSTMEDELKKLILKQNQRDIFDGVVESVRAKEKLKEIYEVLKTVVDGQIIFGQGEEIYLKNDNLDKPLSVHNLSTGIKSFAILKMLLEKGCLKDKDVLILDEPEIHLHPQWQIVYAQLIVLLQKNFDLSIIVTTHSPYFVDALDLFSHKYEINKKVNYYLASNTEAGAIIERVTDNIDLIYKKMASPIQALDTLRHELNNQ